jgi:hypothetical protein
VNTCDDQTCRGRLLVFAAHKRGGPMKKEVGEVRIKVVAIQVCVTCGLEAPSFTDAGLCSVCEVSRRNRIQANARPKRVTPRKKK